MKILRTLPALGLAALLFAGCQSSVSASAERETELEAATATECAKACDAGMKAECADKAASECTAEQKAACEKTCPATGSTN